MAGSDEKRHGQDSERPGRRAFTPKWRQRAEASTPLHPNLQPGPEEESPAAAERAPGKKKFQPRWRQRADEMAAREKQQQLSEPSLEEQVAQLGFQPRWRRTSGAPLPSPEPVEPKTETFQPRWRQRVTESTPSLPESESTPSRQDTAEKHEPDSGEPAPARKFVPRWRQRAETPGGPSPEPSPAPSAGMRGFVPRWRQRARAEPAEQAEARPTPVPEPPPGELEPGQRRFAPRWRRTAAGAEGSEMASPASAIVPASEAPTAENGPEAPVPTALPQAPETEPEAGSAPSPGLAAHLRARAQRLRELEKAAREQLAAQARQAAEVPELPLPALPDLPASPEEAVPAEEFDEGQSVDAGPSVPDFLSQIEETPVALEAAPPAAVALGAPLAQWQPQPEEQEASSGDESVSETTVGVPDFPEPPRTEPEIIAGAPDLSEPPHTEPGFEAEITEPLGGASPVALPEPETGTDASQQQAPRATPVEANETPARKVTLTALPLESEEVGADLPTVEPAGTPDPPTSRYLPPPEAAPSPTLSPQYRNPVLQAAEEMVREPQRPWTTAATPAPRAQKGDAFGAGAAPPRLANPVPAASPARPAPPARAVATPAPSRPAVAEKKRERSVSAEEVATFTRQLSTMIGAGLPLHQALNFFAESGSGGIADIADTLATKIASGFRLSNAMAHFPTVFSDVYVGLIELGETTSHIDEALERLADLMEKQVRLAKRLSSALVYPAFLILVCLAAIGVFLQYVLPTMIPLFQSFSMQLPWPTRMLLWSRHLVWPSVALFGLLLLAWRWFKPFWLRARRSRARWAVRLDRTLLALPAVGKFAYQLATARILFALATMLDTGLPLLNAMKRCESVAANLEIATRLERAGASLKEGDTITEALSQHDVLPPACIHLMAAGEESAHLAEMVQYAARFYEEEVDQSIAQFMSLVEPFIMVVMGVVVAFIVLSAVLPTVQMINQLGV